MARKMIISMLAAVICLCGYNLCKISWQYSAGAQTEADFVIDSQLTPKAAYSQQKYSGVFWEKTGFPKILYAQVITFKPSALWPIKKGYFTLLNMQIPLSGEANFLYAHSYDEFANENSTIAEDDEILLIGEDELTEANALNKANALNEADEVEYEPVEEPIKEKKKSTKSKKVNTQLPKSGAGYKVACSAWPEHQWGTPDTIASFQRLGEEWAKYGYGIIYVSDISLQDGGEMPGHDTHQNGVDIDIFLRDDEKGQGSNINSKHGYSQDVLRKLIQTILATGDVSYILFNDETLIKEFNGIVHKWDNHDDHLHIRYY
ncbi:MAG: penicillin-insensitive murein endopeptidase [Clostridiales bacterium]|nr:penicillin-insensitive murein endopeptidase [Clostridiales bacterium]